MTRMKIIILCCFLVLLAPASAFAVHTGDQLPVFVGKDLNGNTVDLNTIVGNKPVMLVFWAVKSKDCKKKLPEINKLFDKYSEKGLVFIGIDVGKKDTAEQARAFVKENNMAYPNILDKDGELLEKYALNGVFALIAAAKDGTVMMRLKNIPEFDDSTLEVFKTYVGPKNRKTMASDKAEK